MAKVAKATSRKRANRRNARASRAPKARSRRPSTARTSKPRVARAPEIVPDSEIVGEEFSYRSEIRSLDEDLDDELSIYSPNRGETAG